MSIGSVSGDRFSSQLSLLRTGGGTRKRIGMLFSIELIGS